MKGVGGLRRGIGRYTRSMAPAACEDTPVSNRLLAKPGSHPCASVAAMLDAKGVAYSRVDLVPALARLWLRATGFRRGTVPALRLDGVRVQGTGAIARALDARWPEPPLFPADPGARARVEEIEAWGDGPLQELARRINLWALRRCRPAVRAALEGARLQFHLPVGIAGLVARPFLRLDGFINGANTDAVRADLAALPGMLDHVDSWIKSGDVGADAANAAAYQLAGSLRLLLTFEDLAPLLEDRPAGALARRLIPVHPGRVPPGVLPAEWLPRA